ncbi:hypothetical protein DM01DRAFT_1394189 [Hesseltinella vesiculosa]|uniref:Uncharacterized protein n=1 Tax=Hesseltinella vesiculosa TaxID=101127 RepID=A0A1X2GAS9_9FUNG|nr:hypothetical protein DM01DRAFT_1394189 [Hesseltinella vesiculosa]
MIGGAVKQAIQASPSHGQDHEKQRLYAQVQKLHQENSQMQDQLRRLYSFKRSVIKIFQGLNVQVPGRAHANMDNIEHYINKVKAMLELSGHVDDETLDRIAGFVRDNM